MVLNMPVNDQMERGYFVTNRLIFLILYVFSMSVYAESITAPPSVLYSMYSYPSYNGSTAAAACSAWAAGYGGTVTAQSETSCTIYRPAPHNSSLTESIALIQSGVACPSGQNWTLVEANCIRPDCVAPQIRNSGTGVCEVTDPCAGKETQPPVTGWYPSAVGTPSLESTQYCDGGCAAALNASPTGTQYANKTTRWQQYSKVQLGYTCSAGLPTAPISGGPNKQPPEPPKKPPCLAAEGVLTSSTGAVHCVPEGTPGAAPPVVTKTKDVQNFPDGSTKITETTTTRDSQTGAEVKGQTITATPATGGGAGAAGTPGTTSGTEEKGTTTGGDPAKPGDSDFCAKNPGLQMCKGGMNEEATQKEIKDKLTEINESLNPDEDANKEGLEAEKTGYEEKAMAHKEFIDAFASKGQNDEGFLSWAWIPEVPASACAPFTGTIAGKTITLDWCEQLGMVRDIAGYMFYILTAFGLFRIFANSTGATS